MIALSGVKFATTMKSCVTTVLGKQTKIPFFFQQGDWASQKKTEKKNVKSSLFIVAGHNNK